MTADASHNKPGERVAKVIARAGLASRREAEAWIAAGRVSVNGAVISSPALDVTARDRIAVDGQPLPQRARTRLFRYHKPRGLVTTHADPQGRPTLFARLPKRLPRLISVGRLDLNSEGLLLLTNDGGLARALELPTTGWERRYRVRALGRIRQDALDRLRRGVTVAGIRYGAIAAVLDREQGANIWLTVSLREGKNREVRRVLEHLGLRVNRLIRVAYGPFELGDIKEGEIEEVETDELRRILGPELIAQAGADFDAPVEPQQERSARAGDRTRKETAQRGRRGLPTREAAAHAARARGAGKGRPRRKDRAHGPRPKHPRPR
jgi:23S rRNA pseudouridine2605 synthase